MDTVFEPTSSAVAGRVEANARAAVLVIDNERGFFGFDADLVNKLGERVFGDLLTSHYDRVFIVTAHDRESEDDAVARALKQAASQFGTVDMFVHMHTNMSDGRLAKV